MLQRELRFNRLQDTADDITLVSDCTDEDGDYGFSPSRNCLGPDDTFILWQDELAENTETFISNSANPMHRLSLTRYGSALRYPLAYRGPAKTLKERGRFSPFLGAAWPMSSLLNGRETADFSLRPCLGQLVVAHTGNASLLQRRTQLQFAPSAIVTRKPCIAPVCPTKRHPCATTVFIMRQSCLPTL